MDVNLKTLVPEQPRDPFEDFRRHHPFAIRAVDAPGWAELAEA